MPHSLLKKYGDFKGLEQEKIITLRINLQLAVKLGFS